MFPGAFSKLEDSRLLLEQLRQARDALSFKMYFNSYLNASRAITYALQKDGSKIAGFDEWYKEKQEEMKNDELLKFIHQARTEDFHEGKHRLEFFSEYKIFDTSKVGSPPAPNAAISLGAKGAYWIIDEGTPRQRTIPIQQGGEYSVNISIKGAPKYHRGKFLFNNNAIMICELANEYFTQLVYEAKQKFRES